VRSRPGNEAKDNAGFHDAGLLTDAQKWTVVVYILANHNVIRRDETIDPQRASTISIP
jgi:hypothetical protein